MHGYSHQHTFARLLQTAKNVRNCNFFLLSAAWVLTLCMCLLDHCAHLPHRTQQLDQNQPEKLLEDQKRVCPDISKAASLTALRLCWFEMRHYRHTTLVRIVFVFSLHRLFLTLPNPQSQLTIVFQKRDTSLVTLLTYFPGPPFPRGIYSKARTECVQKDKLLLFNDCQMLISILSVLNYHWQEKKMNIMKKTGMLRGCWLNVLNTQSLSC